VKVVSNASPLITVARIGHLDSLHKLYEAVHIPTEVYNQVVTAGAGMPGAAAVSKADWIHVSPVTNTENLAKTKRLYAVARRKQDGSGKQAGEKSLGDVIGAPTEHSEIRGFANC
jgi:predicted nucleic acid-binding protein